MEGIDIVIPVFNEGENIIQVLEAFRQHVKSPFRVLICYDFEEDDTLTAIASYPHRESMDIVLVRNPGRGPHSAIMAGLRASKAPAVLSWMGDDDFNAHHIDPMVEKFKEGYDIVTGGRFMPGGCMVGCVWYKALLTRTASFTLRHLARLPVHDATNGVRLFSRRLIDSVEIESNLAFLFTFEMMVKCVRLGLPVYELPVAWFERKGGVSKFKVLGWIGWYLPWYFYAFATTWLGRGPKHVKLKPGVTLESVLNSRPG
jgi:dolichol-phosphate mannosyltransferase